MRGRWGSDVGWLSGTDSRRTETNVVALAFGGWVYSGWPCAVCVDGLQTWWFLIVRLAGGGLSCPVSCWALAAFVLSQTGAVGWAWLVSKPAEREPSWSALVGTLVTKLYKGSGTLTFSLLVGWWTAACCYYCGFLLQFFFQSLFWLCSSHHQELRSLAFLKDLRALRASCSLSWPLWPPVQSGKTSAEPTVSSGLRPSRTWKVAQDWLASQQYSPGPVAQKRAVAPAGSGWYCMIALKWRVRLWPQVQRRKVCSCYGGSCR